MSKLKEYQGSLEQATQQALQQMEKPKIGAGSGWAALRMGHDEIGQVFRATPESIQLTPEMGAIGEPTPQEVFADKQEASPLQVLQKDLYTPKMEQQQEQER